MNERYPLPCLLVGYQGDERSDRALQAALQVRHEFGSRLRIASAIDLPKPEWLSGDPVESASRNAEWIESSFNRLANRLSSQLSQAGYDHEPVEEMLSVVPGPPGRVLVDQARAEEAAIVFLGAHEKRGLLDFGSTARAVLAHAPDGVWVQPCPVAPVRRILAPVDLSDQSLRALDVARAMAQQFGSELTVLHGFEPPDFAYPAGGDVIPGPAYVIDDVRDGVRKGFEETISQQEWSGIEPRLAFREGRPVSVILEEIQEGGHDLVVLGSHGRTGLSSVVLGNVAYGVLRESAVPVLALRHPGREWLV